jgi:formate dehydrogenase iron-sulfur subunit
MKTLIDELLSEQARLQTPVARFSDQHDREPDLADHYRTLIPLSKPVAGEQYAFEVALDRCTGCKACVSACHSLNGLDDHEAWRDTGLLLGGAEGSSWQQTITTACHHCEDPGCLSGCPVGAYEKDRDTGIVRHLDDQCIGCSYCILKCPYDVPKYSKKRGIVRKCDMCHQRLAVGEAPACVQACPTEAIRIVKVEIGAGASTSLRRSLLSSSLYDPSSAVPDSAITRPTTRYVGRDVPATAFAADRTVLQPQHAHWPLVWMLVLTQAGIGLGAAAMWAPAMRSSLLFAGALLFYLGMAASVLHLGHPLKAWRFFLGLRTSWLSREILAFSLFAPIPLWLVASPFLPEFPFDSWFTLVISYVALPLGMLAMFTSVMIYHDTHRSLWKLPRTALRFFGTAACCAALAHPAFLAGAITIKLLAELWFLRHARQAEWSPDQHSARLQLGPLRRVLAARIACAWLAIPAAALHPFLGLPLLLAAEVLERQLFFQSVQSPKMPGNRFPGSH